MVLERYTARQIRPATELSDEEEIEAAPFGGIGYMGIEVDFYGAMRTIAEIKESIEADFMRNETAARLCGFTAGDSFAAFFGKLSVESVLFYLFAVAAWTLKACSRHFAAR